MKQYMQLAQGQQYQIQAYMKAGFNQTQTANFILKKGGGEVNLPQFNGHFKSEAVVSQKECPNDQTTKALQDLYSRV
ncbi:hypothetical protein [Thiohalophilus sp.]|uniref:hypothetical protein n=1 Tax=Thiohalophilus sp. TaxID=3028392 RepID=UPI002ACD8DB3|nr:hypothetical protein [Thiohalophilus sp.]MDZ7663577.1 hypothetical protein [Thiohalophilus sp.]